MVQRNRELLPQIEPAKRKGIYTGQRLKLLRPETYRRVVELLAEPREHVPYDHICRLLRVSEHTVKAIERAESASIAERKQRLLAKALRIANKAADRIEDQIDGANITQATVAFGVATEKALLLSGDPTLHVGHSLQLREPVDIARLFQEFHDALRAKAREAEDPVGKLPHAHLALPNSGTIADSRTETDPEPIERAAKTN
jgi:hypothetical protein